MEQYPDIPVDEVTSDQIADAIIRNYCGWHIAPVVEETLILDGSGSRRLALPSLRVVGVSSLSVNGAAVTDYSWSQDGWLTLPHGSFFPAEDRAVVVTLEHGYSYAPELLQVRRGITARTAMSPAGNVVSQRAGSQSVTFGSVGGEVLGAALLNQEKELLAKYRLNWGW